MVMKLVIATTNINKIKRLTKIIRKINNNIEIEDISKLKIKAPDEDSNNQKKNLLKKLYFYKNLLKTNVFCEDDAFKFRKKNNYISIVKVNNFFYSPKNLYKSWLEYFKSNEIYQGKLIKYFGTIIEGKIKTTKIVIPLIVKTSQHRNVVVEKNVLNNFIGPELYEKTFVEMSNEEKDNYMERKYLSALKKLFR